MLTEPPTKTFRDRLSPGKSTGNLIANTYEDHTLSREDFNRLAAEWKSQAEFLASPTKIAELPAYQAIIAAGPAAVPLILDELRREPDHWFVALKRITGEDPVPEDALGDIERMTQGWLDWGHVRVYSVETGLIPARSLNRRHSWGLAG